jgi:hypothetical protein
MQIGRDYPRELMEYLAIYLALLNKVIIYYTYRNIRLTVRFNCKCNFNCNCKLLLTLTVSILLLQNKS